MSNQDDSFLREVEEDFRREQFAKLWEKYGLYVLGLAGLIVAGVFGYTTWQNQQRTLAAETGGRYESALLLAETGKADDAAKALATLAKDAPKGYSILARLKLAGVAAKAGKTAEAVAAYESIQKDGGADPLLAGYAGLQAAALRSGDAGWTEMQNRLTPLAGDDGAWRFSARELLAVSAQKAGNNDAARKWYDKLLADAFTPQSMKARVNVMLSMLTQAELAAAKSKPDGKGPDAKTPAGPGAVKSN